MHINSIKTKYQKLQKSLIADFLQNPNDAEKLVQRRSVEIDALLVKIWRDFGLNNDLCLVAVGGYGRGELHLYSDIDLLILIPDGQHKIQQKTIADFLTFLWDIGLEVGHSTRDIVDCVREIADLSVATNLLESRCLIGDEELFFKMKNTLKNSDWSSQKFFVAKQKEQLNRHLKFADTAYSLEPNLKESPGGMRDLQTIAWVAKWHFEIDDLPKLAAIGYLDKDELRILKTTQKFLSKLRFCLHIIANRREDRLAFSHQKQVAKMLNYADGKNRAVEKFMKDYYQNATKVSRLNDILLQILEDKILHSQDLSDNFVIRSGYIQAIKSEIFKTKPSAFIEVFLLLAKNNYVRGISAKTIRQMQLDIKIIDKNYHQKRQNNRLFLELLQQKQGVNRALKLMGRYGILERYIPAFGKITGLMQYDLFHTFTVDQHTLFVVRNLRRFFVDEFAKEFNLCSEIAKTIKNPELLLLAGIFHDIAKGRGGDHSKLGAKDADVFCRHHQLKDADAKLVAKLVRLHLLMSQTAQKNDLDDFAVIAEFAEQIESFEFLQLLYLLTVADIRATKADLWNDWRDALLKKLFRKTEQYLQSAKTTPLNLDDEARQIKTKLLAKFTQSGYDFKLVEAIFSNLPKDYFLRHSADDILWHLKLITNKNTEKTIVAVKISKHNVVDIFVYSDDFSGVFFQMINALEQLNLDIVDAKILTSKNLKTYNTISVLQDGRTSQTIIIQVIEAALKQHNFSIKKAATKLSHRHFDSATKVNFKTNKKWHLTELEISTINKQGLLSNIAYIFHQQKISLLNARIATVGERVDDTFFIRTPQNTPLTPAQNTTLKKALQKQIADV